MARNGAIPLTISGNLTAAPELRFTPSGVATARFTVASTPRRYDQQAGDWKDGEVTFIDCQAWRQLAENVAESFDKGDRITATGDLITERWEHEGEKRSRLRLVADDVAASTLYATVKITRARRQHGPDATDPYTGESATLRERPAIADPAGAR